jgi:hypothetical protein
MGTNEQYRIRRKLFKMNGNYWWKIKAALTSATFFNQLSFS